MPDDKQPTAKGEPSQLMVIDDPTIKTVYVNHRIAIGIGDGGNVSIVLGESRALPKTIGAEPRIEDQAVYVTARLVLSPRAAVELVNDISHLLAAVGVLRPTATEQTPKKPH